MNHYAAIPDEATLRQDVLDAYMASAKLKAAQLLGVTDAPDPSRAAGDDKI